MKTIFRLRHLRGTGYINFEDYGPLLSTRNQHSEWIPFVLSVNEHGLIMSERQLKQDELNSERLSFIKRGS